MPVLRLVTWNCHHGSLASCISDLADLEPDVAFIQEWDPRQDPLFAPPCARREVNATKGVAVIALNDKYALRTLGTRFGSGRASLASRAEGPISFNFLGVWAQAPNYADDVLNTITAYDDLLSNQPSIVAGDLNTGANLSAPPSVAKSYQQLLSLLAEKGLVSAYHAFHGVDHGREAHATYWHQFNSEQPWHIDFCFVPKAWTRQLVRVELADGPKWQKRSDHRPLVVDLAM